ncbi:MAG: SPASM domain-containing protein [Spirochaetes bacterium]|nr:SPASM domain-containing protein [Spirochaetota bacterium]
MRRSFSLLIKPVSYRCNLRCRYCFYCFDNKAELGPAEVMSDETMAALIEQYTLAAEPPYIFAFQGGEPLLAGIPFYERFIDTLNRILPPRTSVSVAIQTNGTLVDDAWVALFKRMNALVGVSIDGDRELHDANRIDGAGTGSFERAVKGFRMLADGGVPVNVLSTVNVLTAEHPERMYRFLREEVKADYLQFIPILDIDPNGKPAAYSVTGERYYHFISEIFRVWKMSDPRPSVRLFDNMYESLLGQTPSSCQLNTRCGGYYLIEANGNIYPCDFYAEKRWYLGNVNTDSFDSVAKSAKSGKFNALKERYREKHCAGCTVESFCHGGCPHYSRTGAYEYCAVNKKFVPEFTKGMA